MSDVPKMSVQPAKSVADEIVIREATAADVDEILRHRRRMFQDMGQGDAATLEKMVLTSRPVLAKGLAEGFYRSWLACTKTGQVIGGAGVIVLPWPTSPREPQARRATILNVYTDPEYRRRGVARRLMQVVIEWCRSAGLAVVNLHASEQGRPLYVSLGFEPTNEMRLTLKQ